MNANGLLFRCYGLKALCTEGKAKGETWGKIAIQMLARTWIMHSEQRFDRLDNKFVRKGLKGENEALTLLSKVRKDVFNKNDVRISNAFITGEIDTFVGESVDKATETIDTKVSWDRFTFEAAKFDDLNPVYEYQGQGYMALSGATKHTVAYCLVNTDLGQVKHELYKEGYNWENEQTPVWMALQLISKMVYDKKTFDHYIKELDLRLDDANAQAMYDGFVEIPLKYRVHQKSFDRNDLLIASIYSRVIDARIKINEDPKFIKEFL